MAALPDLAVTLRPSLQFVDPMIEENGYA